jgi:hypothetical protein
MHLIHVGACKGDRLVEYGNKSGLKAGDSVASWHEADDVLPSVNVWKY